MDLKFRFPRSLGFQRPDHCGKAEIREVYLGTCHREHTHARFKAIVAHGKALLLKPDTEVSAAQKKWIQESHAKHPLCKYVPCVAAKSWSEPGGPRLEVEKFAYDNTDPGAKRLPSSDGNQDLGSEPEFDSSII